MRYTVRVVFLITLLLVYVIFRISFFDFLEESILSCSLKNSVDLGNVQEYYKIKKKTAGNLSCISQSNVEIIHAKK